MDDHAFYPDTIRQYESWELDDILHNVDRAKFPERYQIVMDEIDRRAEERKAENAEQEDPSIDFTPLNKPHTIRELISDLLQPVKTKKAIGVQYTNETFLWILVGLIPIFSILEALVGLGIESLWVRIGVLSALIAQFFIIFTAFLKRPSVIFFMKFWSATLVICGSVIFIIGVVGFVFVDRSASVYVAFLQGGVILAIGVVYFAFAEKCITPVFEDASENAQ